MKTRLLLVFSFLFSIVSFSQGTESFTNMPASASGYATRTWTGDNGLQWTATDARTDQTINGRAVAIRAGAVSCSGIPNGIGNLSFSYMYLFTAGGSATLDVKVNGNVVTTITVPMTATTATTATVDNINIPGTFSLEIAQTAPAVGTSSAPRVAIDDVTWTIANTAPCAAPAAQPTGLVLGSLTNSSISGSFTAASPAADEYVVVASTSSTLSATPANGTVYNVDDVLGNGVVVARSANLSFTAESLTQGTTYYFYVFSVSSVCSGGPLYFTASPLTGSATTTTPAACTAPAAAPANLSFVPSNTSINGTVDASATTDGYLVVYNTSGTLDFTPQNGTTYTVGQNVGSVNTGKVASYGPGTTFSVSALTPSTTYYFFVFASNGFNCSGGPLYFATSTNGTVNTTANSNTGIPSGYYTNATGKSCAELKTALKTITTTGMTPRSYGDLWSQYVQTDVKPREVGTGSAKVIWDIYSDNPNGQDPYNFTPTSNQCGSYSAEGQCYNREHSFPQNWFTGGTANGPGTDYHHIFPTDGKVNGMRSNYIFGEVASATYTSLNGSKLGSSSVAGLTGPVFEPINEYKGDLARAFLYMVTRYENNMPSWGAQNSAGTQAIEPNTYPSVDVPYLKLMLKWHHQDPVSQKEIDRNNGGYTFQKNRNPFVDHPEYVDMIWNNTCPGLSALPVEIMFFGGKLANGEVKLQWTVENELNFHHYDVERSFNGTSYSAIGQVSAANLRNYSFGDNADPLRGRRVYYRLKKVDRDGKDSYSEVFTLHIPNNTRFTVYPNPASKYIMLQMNSTVAAKVTVQISDAAGRLMQQQSLQVAGSTIRLSTDNLSNGTYVIKLIYNGEQYIQKVLVAK